MMSKKFLFILAICVASVSIPVTGQSFLEKMAKHAKQKAKKEAENRAEKKATEKIDKEIDKAFDNLEKQFEKEQKKEDKKDSKHSTNPTGSNNDSQQSINKDLNKFMSKMGVSTTPVPIEDSYSFNSSVTMNFKSYSKDGKLKNDGNMISYFVSGKNTIAYEFIDGNIRTSQKDKTGTFILDYKNKATIILSNENGQKTGMAYGLGDMVNDDDWNEAMKDNPNFKQGEAEAVNPYVKKTGRTKSILGYSCEEYKYDDEEISSTFWITDDVSWNNRGVISNIFSASIYSYGTPNGFLMESVSVDKKTGEKSTYTITDINKNTNKTFDVTQYQITNIGSMGMPQSE